MHGLVKILGLWAGSYSNIKWPYHLPNIDGFLEIKNFPCTHASSSFRQYDFGYNIKSIRYFHWMVQIKGLHLS